MTKYGRIKKLFIAVICCLLTMQSAFCVDMHALHRIEKKKIETRSKINHLKILENKETNRLYRNQLKYEKAKQELDYSKVKYSNVQTKLSTLEYNLGTSTAECKTLEIKARQRIIEIFKKQKKGVIEFIFAAKDINDLQDRIYYQSIITKNDKRNLELYKAKARRIAQLKMQIEQQKMMLAYSIRNINAQQQNIQKAISQNESYIQKLRTDRHTYERAEKDLAIQSASLRNMISRSSAKDTNMKVSGGFIKPIGGGITSPFGWRVHPIFKSRTFHSGIDIGGPYGGAVRASNSGRVIYAGWYGGYGKVVIIDHGRQNGRPVSTLYAHLSSINVGVGTNVSRGTVVGREGSTGYSTGPHVHFEVRVNGVPQNPLNYI